ncbi:MAG: cobalt ECF transporter T component CbiQ [Methanoregulaceae archaeon]|nr:cobalt ECF transporter T component CbiQ [Methanoregulaceae archaeon]
MYEEFLENIAQKNGLVEVNTFLKLAAGLGGILLCLVSTSFIAPLFIAALFSAVVLVLARVNARIYVGIFIMPFWFAAMSVFTIVLVSGGGEVFWSWNPFPWLMLSVTRGSINQGVFVFCRFLGAMSAMIFISLTTPMTELFVAMRRCRIPNVVLDLAMMIYRAIFIIMDQLVQTYHAQQMRLGYSSFRESIRSFAALCGSVFIASWDAGEDLVRAMDARCYEGKFAIMGETRPVQFKSALLVASFLGFASLLVVFTGNISILQVLP